MKHCNKCGVGLVVGENVSESQIKYKQYRCKSCVRMVTRLWTEKNPHKKYERTALYRKRHPGRVNALSAKRNARKKAQTPSWYCHETVTAIYEVASEFGYEVDHIVPLAKGGLHSHENLQLLTKSENAQKGANECWL